MQQYDASVFPGRVHALAETSAFLIPPSIDPLSDKNRELTDDEVDRQLAALAVDRKPLVVQISRFDRFKNPVGLVRAFRRVRKRDACRSCRRRRRRRRPRGRRGLARVVTRPAAIRTSTFRARRTATSTSTRCSAPPRSSSELDEGGLRPDRHRGDVEGEARGRGGRGRITLQVHDHRTGFLVHSEEGLSGCGIGTAASPRPWERRGASRAVPIPGPPPEGLADAPSHHHGPGECRKDRIPVYLRQQGSRQMETCRTPRALCTAGRRLRARGPAHKRSGPPHPRAGRSRRRARRRRFRRSFNPRTDRRQPLPPAGLPGLLDPVSPCDDFALTVAIPRPTPRSTSSRWICTSRTSPPTSTSTSSTRNDRRCDISNGAGVQESFGSRCLRRRRPSTR